MGLQALGRVARGSLRRLAAGSARVLGAVPPVKSRVVPWLLRQRLGEVPIGRQVEAIRTEVEKVARSQRPVVVGPWLSEVGFELLYWIPFLDWMTREFALARDRLIVVSRGGVASWYGRIAGRYLDVFDLLTVEGFRQKNEERWLKLGHQKQMVVTEFDWEIVRLAQERLGTGEVALLHPSLMYRLFRYYWFGSGALGTLEKHTVYQRLPAVTADEVVESLPRDYVAVRFYFRPSFPDTPENRAFAEAVVENLTRRADVVLLNSKLVVDDHVDFTPAANAKIHRIDHLMVPRNNLEIQTKVMSRARAFVGTFGGLAYLASFHGAPALAFYSDAHHLVPTHVEVAQRVCGRLGTSLLTMNAQDARLVRLVFDGMSG